MKIRTLFSSIPFLLLSTTAATAQSNTPQQNPCLKAYDSGDYELAARQCRTLAERSPSAQRIMGLMNFFGHGVLPNSNVAATWFQRAATQGDAIAQWQLGRLYSAGLGVDPDPIKAFQWYQAAAKQGLWEAKLMVSLSYHLGIGTPEDRDKAFEWYQSALDSDMPYAKPKTRDAFKGGYYKVDANQPGHDAYMRGINHLLGIQGDPHPNEALLWFEQAADQRHPEALFQLGLLYLYGEGADQEAEQAYDLMYQAQAQGHQKAKAYLAWLTLLGLGTPFDDDTAIEWYNKALQVKKTTEAKKQEAQALVPDTLAWYLEAAHKGDAKAQYIVGTRYLRGQGTSTDRFEAYRWINEAAQQNYGLAQYRLGVMFIEGEGVIQDPKTGLEWLKKAAQGGQAEAQYEIGLMYYMGRFLQKNPLMAYAWLNLAGSQNLIEAQSARTLLINEMSPAQIEDGEELSIELYKTILDRNSAS